MANRRNTGIKDTPIKLANEITAIVNRAWEDGSFLENVTPVTRDLLRYWFSDVFCDTRPFNFHSGQKQSILNTIYVHEVLQVKSVSELYAEAAPELLEKIDDEVLQQAKYQYPKYCMKMATGTGKTWVMGALLVWQYLNAKEEYDKPTGRYSKRFLLVAPGLIVYERLLDSYLGKEMEDGTRNFETSDFKKFEALFIPPAYKETFFSFLQTSVVPKEEIGQKVTGDGMIAITNWHLLAGVEDEQDEVSPFDDPSQILEDLLPIRPGKTAGHALDSLDRQYLSGGELDFLAELPDLVVFNDEAHHIHEIKQGNEIIEVEWQKSLNKIAEKKGTNFIQIDFSATPYDVTGSGQKRTKHYFPHIIVDFDLKSAIHQGLVKTIALDRRKELTVEELDYKAVRDGRKAVALSEGQKLMLRAGLQKLRILEKEFGEFTKGHKGLEGKHPKMLVICEDTTVSPLVTEFLTAYEGLSEEDVMQIDSDKKGNVSEKEWKEIKQRLFNVDRYEKPRVIVSVLMLREGFDVNNICVIVPLRSSEAPILLEQIVGRGLRLMWREPEFLESKAENRIQLLEKKQEPNNYLDILSIVEHPTFLQFYEDLMQEGLVGETEVLPGDRESILGDMIHVGLKGNYPEYDLFWPIIVREQEEELQVRELSADYLSGFQLYDFDQLKQMAERQTGETFFSEEATVRTRFGDYQVTGELFTAKSYNEFLAKLVQVVTISLGRVSQRKIREFPVMQIHHVELLRLIDEFIRFKLFNRTFDPMQDNNWKILMLVKTGIVEHVIKEVSRAIYEMQTNVNVSEAIVMKRYFSEVNELRMRENFALNIVKTIYEKLPYPSNKGEFEKNFMLFCDRDSKVDAFVKINEYYHSFASIMYVRTDGMLASYYPDFLVKIGNKLFVVETKAQKDLDDANVKQKQYSALDWIKKVNQLRPENRMDCEWSYVLLGEITFYEMIANGSSATDMFDWAKLRRAKIEHTLF